MARGAANIERRSIAVQVRDHLRQRVISGEFAPGDQLPSEAECSSEYGVSRSSAREAFKLLEQEGLIVVRHGHGRFVSPSAGFEVPGAITLFRSITDLLTSQGLAVSSRVLAVETRPPTEEEASALAIPAEATVVYLERFRLGDGEPVVYSQCAFDRQLLDKRVEEIDWGGSVVDLLESAGRRLESAVAEIQAVNLPRAVARKHRIPAASAWLLVTETSLDQKGRPVLFARDYLRGDVRSFHVVQRREI
jgi:GntR family transcriptional regulator